MNPKALEAKGVVIHYEEKWVGKVGTKQRRPKPVFSQVRGVSLGLTPKEWCSIAMREGSMYIGGCCGTTSAMQDVINGIFRDSGYAKAEALYELGMYAKQHPDGFEDWGKKLTQTEFVLQCSKWRKLSPWDKIGLVWQAVRGKIRPGRKAEPIVQENRPDLDAKREIDELFEGLMTFRYHIFRPKENGADTREQLHANDVLTWAKLLPGARRLVSRLEQDFTRWCGYAIVEKARPETITHNGYGLCLFFEKKDAEALIAEWDRNGKPRPGEERTADKVLVRPVVVSVQDGVEFA